MSRDPEFSAGFLKRHQNNLMFGSDCACADGKGTGVSQQKNPIASRMAGKCVARETLTVLNKHLDGASLTKVTWGDAHRLYKIG